MLFLLILMLMVAIIHLSFFLLAYFSSPWIVSSMWSSVPVSSIPYCFLVHSQYHILSFIFYHFIPIFFYFCCHLSWLDFGYIYIYIYIHIFIKSYWKHRIPESILPSVHHYHLSLLAYPLDCIKCLHIVGDWPTVVCPCIGVHKKHHFMSSSWLLHQCPACLVCLIWFLRFEARECM